MFIVMFMVFAMPDKGSRDPRLEMENAAVEEVTMWIIQKLDEVTEHGRKTAPTMSTLLKPLESSINAEINGNSSIRYPSIAPPRDPKIKIKIKEIRRLKALYADWDPIYKWGGVDDDSGVDSSSPATQES